MDRDSILANIRLTTLIEDTNVTDAQIVVIINQGVQEVGVMADWPWLEASATLTFVADQNNYALGTVAADFNRAVALVDDDNDENIEYISPAKYFQLVGNDTGNTSTTPTFWTIWEDDILLTPTPSAADTDRLKLYYYKNPTTLSTGATLPEWDAAYHWALVEYAKWKLWQREEYFDVAAIAKGEYLQYVQGMIDFYERRVRHEPWIVGDGIVRFGRHTNIADLRL